MNEAEILAATYFDTCVIERMSDIENTESGITEQVYFPIHVGKLPCAFSQGSMGNLPVIENKEAFNISYEEQKLFYYSRYRSKTCVIFKKTFLLSKPYRSSAIRKFN